MQHATARPLHGFGLEVQQRTHPGGCTRRLRLSFLLTPSPSSISIADALLLLVCKRNTDTACSRSCEAVCTSQHELDCLLS